MRRPVLKYIKHTIFMFLLIISHHSFSQNHTIPGKADTPYPTILNIGIEWRIEGDDNLNGTVSVRFREKREKKWREGMSLRRVPAGKNVNFSWDNKHAGSLFDLKPDTEYEIELHLKDPDGGSEERTLMTRTRLVPEIKSGNDIVEIEPGNYDTLFTENGAGNKYRVYRCSKGVATFSFIDLQNKKWVFIEGLNVNNLREKGIGIKLNGSENCVVRHCTINAVYGIVAYKPGVTNCYFSDNTITGTCTWISEAMGHRGKNIGEGIEITGPGNVICYNKVTGFRDCISTMEDQHVVNQTGIDIYNNDIYLGLDDGIEADFCFSNCRIMRNRMTNCYVGLSSQPGLGGPNYFIRNVMYNVIFSSYKLHRGSIGDVIMHNTVIKIGSGMGQNMPVDHSFFRNNLAIGGIDGGRNWGGYGTGGPSGSKLADPGKHSDMDYDAVGVFGADYVAEIGKLPFSEVEKNGIERITIGDVFDNVAFPYPPIPERAVPDLRPKANSRVVDAGVVIANVNDDHKGKAPDCGAYEAGQKLPHYGPRSGPKVKL